MRAIGRRSCGVAKATIRLAHDGYRVGEALERLTVGLHTRGRHRSDIRALERRGQRVGPGLPANAFGGEDEAGTTLAGGGSRSGLLLTGDGTGVSTGPSMPRRWYHK